MADVVECLPDRLLVPLDGSDFARRALPFAAEWASRFGAEVEVITTAHTIDPERRKTAPAWLHEAAAELDVPRVSAQFVDRNDPVAVISELVEADPRTSLCMSTHGRGPFVGTALGHVAEELVRRVSTPTALIGPHCRDHQQGPMVVCHDGSPLADAVLCPAAAWAHALDLPLVLVHAIHSLDVESARSTSVGLRRAADRLGAPPPMICRSSNPAGALLELFTELNPSIVALTTHGRSGIARIALGSVATHLVRSSPCPLLVVRPTEFDVQEES